MFKFLSRVVLCMAASAVVVVGCASPQSAVSHVGRGAYVDQGSPSLGLHVDPGAFAQHVSILADDSMTGRGVGTPGIDMAAGYIAGQFASIGLEPGGDDGTYFQTFEMATGTSLTDECMLRVDGVEASIACGEDFTPFRFSSNDAFDGDVVFVGYGIVNPEKSHNDYEGVDVNGKVVLMLRREPPDWADGGRSTRYASFRAKVYEARDAGAAAVLIVNRVEDGASDRLMRFGRGGGRFGVPSYHITQELAGKILAAGNLPELESLQNRLDEGENVSTPVAGVHAAGQAGIEVETAEVRNVLGIIRGEGPLAHEFVAIGGHYDHLGNSVPRMPSFGQPRSTEAEIHNGADDNASGTAGVIEVGRVLAGQHPLKRSVLLMTYTGEETGLIGSKHYVENPTVPIEDTVAMLNMDMIGRMNDEATIQVFGTEAAEEFDEMMSHLAIAAGMSLRASASAVGPSDHTSFYRKKIPSMHFFTGLHGDYHRPGDDTDKVNMEGGARSAELVAATALEIINADRRPTYKKPVARTGRSSLMSSDTGEVQASTRPRVVMGVMPSYMDTEKREGMEIDGVSAAGPAEKAGLKGGDLILKIGNTDVGSVYDYMGALRNNKPGDVVTVIIKRGDKQMDMKVKLAGQ